MSYAVIIGLGVVAFVALIAMRSNRGRNGGVDGSASDGDADGGGGNGGGD